MTHSYDFKSIEAKWQQKWEEGQHFKVSEDSQRPKYYCLEMFPYPSETFIWGMCVIML